MLREFHSYGIWFSVYELLLSQVIKRENKSRNEIPGCKIAGCGVVTGVVLWAANYPFDVVKSKMQADRFGEGRKYRNMRHVVWQMWRSDGLYGFFRGLWPTLVRAVPVSAGTFVVLVLFFFFFLSFVAKHVLTMVGLRRYGKCYSYSSCLHLSTGLASPAVLALALALSAHPAIPLYILFYCQILDSHI